MEGKKEIVTRLVLVYILLLLLWGVAIVFQIVKIQFIEGAFWTQKAESRTVMMRDVEAQRGNIYSDDGKLLATTVPIYDVYIDLGKEFIPKPGLGEPEEAYLIPDSVFTQKNLNRLCDSLSRMFPRYEASYYKTNLQTGRKKKSRFVLIQKNVSHPQLERMKRFPIMGITPKKKKQDTINRIPPARFSRAIIPVIHEQRVNPYNDLARRTIGVRDTKDGCDTCYRGLDGAYNEYLKGVKGQRLERRLAQSIWVPIEDENYKRAEDGLDVVSTIDVLIQELAESSLRRCLDSNDADKGCVVLMEVETGYIRAISNLALTSEGTYYENNDMAVSDLYEPGSTFKTITMMLLLEDKICDTGKLVPTGMRTFNKEIIKDVNSKDYGMVSLKRAFEVSSNVGITYAAYEGYNKRRKDFRDGLMRLFPSNKLGLDLKTEEPAPTFLEDMRPDRNFLNLAYGYGSSMTPLQMLTFHNAIANNGKMVKPLFVSELTKAGKVEKHFDPVVIKEKICSDRTIKQLQDLLKSVVKNGTARKLSSAPYGIAGKTGTSQVGYENKGEKLRYRASFVGYFPTDNPKYSCMVVIQNPKKNRTHGGELAAPVFRDIADLVCGTRLNIATPVVSKGEAKTPSVALSEKKELNLVFSKLGILYISDNVSSKWVYTETIGNDSIECKAYSPKMNIMPGTNGMTIKDALYLLENLGLKVTYEGRGKVIKQSLPMGSDYRKGDRVHLILG